MEKIKLPEPTKAYYPQRALKKSYAIELTSEQENFLKARFKCQDDWELRLSLQKIIDDMVVLQSPTSQDTSPILSRHRVKEI